MDFPTARTKALGTRWRTRFGHVTCFAHHQEQALQIGVILIGKTVEHLVEPVSGIGTTITATTGGASWLAGSTRRPGYCGERSEWGHIAPEIPTACRTAGGRTAEMLAIVSTVRYVDCASGPPPGASAIESSDHVQVPPTSIHRLPVIDFSRLDVNALRNSGLSKRLSELDIPSFDCDRVTALVRDAAYLTVGLGVVAIERHAGSSAPLPDPTGFVRGVRAASLAGLVDPSDKQRSSRLALPEGTLPVGIGLLIAGITAYLFLKVAKVRAGQ